MDINISIQQLKQQRLTPAEKFVLDTIKGAKAKEPDSLGDVKWYKDGKWILVQSFGGGYLWVSYDYIRSVLKKEYALNGVEIQQLLTKLLCKYTNNGKLKI
jgi:hypothetical protein